MKMYCSICARGGSKGVKGKNLRPLLGKPLLAHSIEQAKQSGLFEAVGVSSDSQEILDAARQWGADVLVRRPDELASDTAGKIPAIAHCLQEMERQLGVCEVLVDVDATAPLREAADIRGAVELLISGRGSNVISAVPARKSPYFNMVELDETGYVRLSKPLPERVLRRQDAPRCFDMNASIYAWKRDAFLRQPAVFYPDTLLYVMREDQAFDIDTELDFLLVEQIFNWRERNVHI